jgi:predicted DNA-binding protein (MmcQ/YjbR family)
MAFRAHRSPDAGKSPILSRLRKRCLALPETSESASWGHPNFRAGKRTFVAFEWVEAKPSIAFRLPKADIALCLQRPGFFPTPYGQGKWVSLNAQGRLRWKDIEALVVQSYKTVALTRMLNALEQWSVRGDQKGAG